jgi:CubicO group peptidase (beta-lactamase class C family)
MKNLILLALLAFGILGCNKELIAPAALSNNPKESRLDKDIDSLVQKHGKNLNTVGMTIGYWKNGQTRIYGYGETELGKGQTPDAHTFFEIGSITKTFTATAIMEWLNEKGLSLDSQIQPFLPTDIPVLSKEGVAITFKQLLVHSSGLAYFPSNINLKGNIANALAAYTETNLFDFLKNGKLNNVPGTTYEYSNTAFGLAGTILARENKMTYGEYIQEKVCTPLGLTGTKATLSPAEKERLSKAYKSGKPTDFWESIGALDGAGVIKSTTSDLIKYGVACINPPQNELGKAMRATQEPTFKDAKNLGEGIDQCLAWLKINPKDGSAPVFFHNGGTGGFNTNIFVDKTNNLVVVVCYNSYDDSRKEESTARGELNNELIYLIRK